MDEMTAGSSGAWLSFFKEGRNVGKGVGVVIWSQGHTKGLGWTQACAPNVVPRLSWRELYLH